MHLTFPRQKSKTLTFPATTLGRLYIHDDYAGERYLCQAAGVIAVPADARLRLLVSAEATDRLAELVNLPEDALKEVSVAGTSITDRQVRPLSHLTALETFSFEHTAIDGSVFEHWSGLQVLRKLSGWWSRMRDSNIRYLEAFPALESVDFSRTPITDVGCALLRNCKRLKFAALHDTAVSAEALQQLQASIRNH